MNYMEEKYNNLTWEYNKRLVATRARGSKSEVELGCFKRGWVQGNGQRWWLGACMFDFVEERKREQQAMEVSGVWRDFFC